MIDKPITVAKKKARRIKARQPGGEVVVIARCISCRRTREIRADEVAPGDMPMCRCGCCMVAIGAASRKKARRR